MAPPIIYGFYLKILGLEVQLCRQLHSARIADGADRSEQCAGHVQGSKAPEIRVIEDVEDFRSKLELEALADTEFLLHREIKAGGRWSIDDSATS